MLNVHLRESKEGKIIKVVSDEPIDEIMLFPIQSIGINDVSNLMKKLEANNYSCMVEKEIASLVCGKRSKNYSP